VDSSARWRALAGGESSGRAVVFQLPSRKLKKEAGGRSTRVPRRAAAERESVPGFRSAVNASWLDEEIYTRIWRGLFV